MSKAAPTLRIDAQRQGSLLQRPRLVTGSKSKRYSEKLKGEVACGEGTPKPFWQLYRTTIVQFGAHMDAAAPSRLMEPWNNTEKLAITTTKTSIVSIFPITWIKRNMKYDNQRKQSLGARDENLIFITSFSDIVVFRSIGRGSPTIWCRGMVGHRRRKRNSQSSCGLGR